MPRTTAPQPPVVTQETVEVTRQEPVINLEAQGTPDVSRPSPIEELMGPDAIRRLIEAGVKQQLESLGLAQQFTQKFVTNEAPATPVSPDFTHFGHYRNDVSPEIEVQELNMDAEVPELEPIRGRYMRFRRGHFFAETENQKKQLDWMLDKAEHSADTTQSLGGNRAIYLDDDSEKIFYCTAGCAPGEFHSASEAKFKAHMRGVHGVIL